MDQDRKRDISEHLHTVCGRTRRILTVLDDEATDDLVPEGWRLCWVLGRRGKTVDICIEQEQPR